MSNGLSGIINTLESLAEYNGPWRALRGETALLKTRLAELREREARLDDVLLVALVGGSGVGKSTLLNALAGDHIAETSEMRPCTSVPTVYHPPGMKFNLSHLTGVRQVARSALEHIALIDTPDSDTIVKEHRRIVEQVLSECDLILLCADSEKYLDEATWSLLHPLRGLRAIVCVQTRVTRPDEAIKNHWLMRLQENEFQIEHYFQVNALRGLDQKMKTSAPAEDSFDFPALERFLRHELDRERVARIKSSNAAGLLACTVRQLMDRVLQESPKLTALKESIAGDDELLAQTTLAHFTAGILAESHLWVQAQGREVGVRAKGFIGSLYRIVEFMRSLPYRLPVWMRFDGGGSRSDFNGGVFFDPSKAMDLAAFLPDALLIRYEALHSDLRMRFLLAGLDVQDSQDAELFGRELQRRMRGVFDGVIQKRLLSQARLLTAWPVAAALDLLPLALVVYSGYLVVDAFLRGNLLPTASFLHIGVVLLLIVGLEIFLMSLGIRLFSWRARRMGLQSLKKSLTSPGLAFKQEKQALADIDAVIQVIQELDSEIS